MDETLGTRLLLFVPQPASEKCLIEFFPFVLFRVYLLKRVLHYVFVSRMSKNGW